MTIAICISPAEHAPSGNCRAGGDGVVSEQDAQYRTLSAAYVLTACIVLSACLVSIAVTK